EIDYPAGAELEIRLLERLTVPRSYYAYSGERTLLPHQQEQLEQIAQQQPVFTQHVKTGEAADLVNFILVGTSSEVDRAFTAAGWNGAGSLSRRCGFHVFRAVATMSPYPNGPMRVLELDGRTQDAEWQKSLNTFARRHHLRLWQASQTWEGRQVWLGAATHDINMKLGLRSVTHIVDGHID